MSKKRGRQHSTLTETSKMVVKEISKMPNIKMIAPGEIYNDTSKGGNKFITIIYTNAGCELLIRGQGTQRVAIHTNTPKDVACGLKSAKTLKRFIFKERNRKPDN